MQKTRGFTFIELVIVLIILGLLSAIAIPYFLNLEKDSRNATLVSIREQIRSQVSLTHAKLALAGLAGKNPNNNIPVVGGGYYGDEPAHNPFKDICGHECYFIFGTPSASATTLSSLMDGIGVGEDIVFAGYHHNDWVSEGVTGTEIVATFAFKENVVIAAKPGQNKLKSETCYIWYSGARADRSYKIGIVPCE